MTKLSMSQKAQRSINDADYLLEVEEGVNEYKGMLYSDDPAHGVFESKDEIEKYFKSQINFIRALGN